jgi:hypothetical protein
VRALTEISNYRTTVSETRFSRGYLSSTLPYRTTERRSIEVDKSFMLAELQLHDWQC